MESTEEGNRNYMNTTNLIILAKLLLFPNETVELDLLKEYVSINLVANIKCINLLKAECPFLDIQYHWGNTATFTLDDNLPITNPDITDESVIENILREMNVVSILLNNTPFNGENDNRKIAERLTKDNRLGVNINLRAEQRETAEDFFNNYLEALQQGSVTSILEDDEDSDSDEDNFQTKLNSFLNLIDEKYSSKNHHDIKIFFNSNYASIIFILNRLDALDIKDISIIKKDKDTLDDTDNIVYAEYDIDEGVNVGEKYYDYLKCKVTIDFKKTIEEIRENLVTPLTPNKKLDVVGIESTSPQTTDAVAEQQIQEPDKDIISFKSEKFGYIIKLNTRTSEVYIDDKPVSFRSSSDKQYKAFEFILRESRRGKKCHKEKILDEMYSRKELNKMDENDKLEKKTLPEKSKKNKKNRKSRAIEELLKQLRMKFSLNSEQLQRDGNFIGFI